MQQALLIVGSVAYDTIETPTGSVEDALGGSAVFAAAAASHFGPAHLVGVVGRDFALGDLAFLKQRGVDLEGLEVADGLTFRWSGVYDEDVNVRHTRSTDLNVFADFAPDLPPKYRSDSVAFLGNIAPELQLHVLDQLEDPAWVALDTMDLWIETARDALVEVIGRVQMLVINDSEARLMTGDTNAVRSAKALLQMGPRAVVVKKGEHGVLLATEDGVVALPALPLEEVLDPTGAGDAFAGGMLGYLSATRDWSLPNLKRSLAFGTATASLAVDRHSVDALRDAERQTVDERYETLRSAVSIT